jgi:REP element-mobilizing transposase RayT
LLDQLNHDLAFDRIRILEASSSAKGAFQLLVSTQPDVNPSFIVQRTKGRLQHVLRFVQAVDFRRNFRLTSVGDANISTVQNYIATQIEHHPMAADHSQDRLRAQAIENRSNQYSQPVYSSHGQYVLVLHLVLVHAERWRNATAAFIEKTRLGFLACAEKYQLRVSRLSILADHLHASFSFSYTHSPETIALAMMNNIAYRHGMVKMWMDSYYVGTIGTYNMNAVRLRLRAQGTKGEAHTENHRDKLGGEMG